MQVFISKSHFCIEDLGADLTPDEIRRATADIPIAYRIYERNYYESRYQEHVATELGLPHRLYESDILSTEEYEEHVSRFEEATRKREAGTLRKRRKEWAKKVAKKVAKKSEWLDELLESVNE